MNEDKVIETQNIQQKAGNLNNVDRNEWIEKNAYYRAQRRNFANPEEAEQDWLKAEAEIKEILLNTYEV